MALEPLLLLSRSLKQIVLGFAVLAPLALGGCDRQSAAPAQPEARTNAARTGTPPSSKGETLQGTIDRSHKGSRLPDFTLSDPKGNRLPLASLAGTPVLLNLWATWCAPCVAEMPALDALAAQRKDSLRVVTVSQDMAGADKVVPFFAQHGLGHLEPWLDPGNDLGFHFGGAQLPTTVYYDAQGREVWRMIGGHDWSAPDTARLLDEVGRSDPGQP
jgi:thiol-disulfide isomerase/thioredoxin